jgi:polar amino acid transport system permease protein
MGNETMTLVKDTALAFTIGVMELFRQATNASSRVISTIPLIAAGIVYFALNYIIEK